MNIISQLVLGSNLAKLTSIMEMVDAAKPYVQDGNMDRCYQNYPGGRLRALNDVERMTASLRKHPRHVVSRELYKNMLLASSLGRSSRVRAQEKLFAVLVEHGVALSIDDFNKSYAG